MTSESAGTSDDGPNIEASRSVETDFVSRWGTDECVGRWRTKRGGVGPWRAQAAPILTSLRLGAPHRNTRLRNPDRRCEAPEGGAIIRWTCGTPTEGAKRRREERS